MATLNHRSAQAGSGSAVFRRVAASSNSKRNVENTGGRRERSKQPVSDSASRVLYIPRLDEAATNLPATPFAESVPLNPAQTADSANGHLH